MFEKELEAARNAALKAGRRIMEFYSQEREGVSVRQKGGREDNPVTEADHAANDIITEELKRFPHPMLTEEAEDDTGRLGADALWVVDPLDGTREFINKLGEFTVNIALVMQGEPVLGVIFVPAKEDLYWAVKGGGAFHEKKGSKRRISVSGNGKISDMTIVRSRSHASENLLRIIKEAGFKSTITSGSSVKGCLIAAGEADVYIRLGPVHEWDICAMDIVVREAGGIMTGLEGKPLKYNKPSTLVEGGFIVSNNRSHSTLLEMIKND